MFDLSKPFCLSFVAEDNCVCCHVVEEQLQLDSVAKQKDFPPWLWCKTMGGETNRKCWKDHQSLIQFHSYSLSTRGSLDRAG